MPEQWVLNASPLILLAKVGQEGLFVALSDRFVVPRAVASEIEAGPADDPGRRALSAFHSQIIDTPLPSTEILAWDLGAGETAVVAYALEQAGWTAILDDAAARKCAVAFDIPVKGTLAIVIQAKQKGIIASAVDVLQSLRDSGFRIDAKVVGDALRSTVGEEWPP